MGSRWPLYQRELVPGTPSSTRLTCQRLMYHLDGRTASYTAWDDPQVSSVPCRPAHSLQYRTSGFQSSRVSAAQQSQVAQSGTGHTPRNGTVQEVQVGPQGAQLLLQRLGRRGGYCRGQQDRPALSHRFGASNRRFLVNIGRPTTSSTVNTHLQRLLRRKGPPRPVRR